VLLAEPSDVFALLYDTCLRLANRTVRDSMLAQEVVQEAFLAAWQHAPARFEPAHGLLANGRCQALPARSRLACTWRTMAVRESSN